MHTIYYSVSDLIQEIVETNSKMEECFGNMLLVGKKKSGREARSLSNEITKLLKEFRKTSIECEKK